MNDEITRNFDLSLIIPLYSEHQLEGMFSHIVDNFQENGIEIIFILYNVAQEPVMDLIFKYPFINWKVILYKKDEYIFSRVLNLGVRMSSKRYIYLVNNDYLINRQKLIEILFILANYYFYYFSLSLPTNRFGGIIVEKKYFEKICGYDEDIKKEYLSEAILRNKLKIENIKEYRETNLNINDSNLFKTFYSYQPKNNQEWGSSKYSLIFDWSCKKVFNDRQCCDYLKKFKDYYIKEDNIFSFKYNLIALIPTYNEKDNIVHCLKSIEKYCDGIIVLDDDSDDETYELVMSNKLLLKIKKPRQLFNDKQNRNILLDISSFFISEWLIFIDADEFIYKRMFDIPRILKLQVDVVGVWIVNLWNNKTQYRTDITDTNYYSRNGIWLRWRLFRNKGRMQLITHNILHFKTVPYLSNIFISKTILLHTGYLSKEKRYKKFKFYKQEDHNNLLDYSPIIDEAVMIMPVKSLNIKSLNL